MEEHVCSYCGRTYFKKYYKENKTGLYFCSIECRRLGGKILASKFSNEFKEKKRQECKKWIKELWTNPDDYHREIMRNAALKRRTCSKDTYEKRYGRHVHRQIMEEYLGRKLSSNEIVHHKDGNKHNNSIDNLEILTQSEHVKKHMINGKLQKGGD